jgi:hypothetical protein
MDKNAGDLKVIWSKDNADEVEAAEEQFDSLIKKGFTAFQVDKNGEAGKKITKFNPSSEKIIMVPQIMGG